MVTHLFPPFIKKTISFVPQSKKLQCWYYPPLTASQTMRIVGHYNIQHIPRLVKVIVLDVTETENACNKVTQFSAKTTIARREADDIVDQLVVDFPDTKIFNFDLKHAAYPIWFYDKVFYQATAKESINYFISHRPSDITERIKFPLQNEAFLMSTSELPADSCLDSDLEVENPDYVEHYKKLLLRVLEYKRVDLDNDAEVGAILTKYKSIQDYLQNCRVSE